MPDHDQPPVVEDRDQNRFVVEHDGSVAELTYRREENRLILVHTGVPDELGGRGVGGRLVRATVEHAAREGLTLVPRCPYARKWLEDHPDAAGTVTVDWSGPSR